MVRHGSRTIGVSSLSAEPLQCRRLFARSRLFVVAAKYGIVFFIAPSLTGRR